jgi:hypothetical protein
LAWTSFCSSELACTLFWLPASMVWMSIFSATTGSFEGAKSPVAYS